MAVPDALDVDGNNLGELEFNLNVPSNSDINTRYGMMGRGTTVFSIRASARSAELFGSDNLVAKISWQPIKRDEEGNIRRIRKKLANSTRTEAREALQYIIDFKCSTSLAINDPNVMLPRAFMKHLPAMEDEDLREFRLMVVKEYLPLQLIDTPVELQTVFCHVIIGLSPICTENIVTKWVYF